jgi:L-aminopeptidase/D-esterase-like protein
MKLAITCASVACAALTLAAGTYANTVEGELQAYEPVLNAGENVLRFDWPMVRVGTGEYAEGPTGVTVFSFGRKVLAAVDVRGGGPGTVNTDFLRLGYNAPELDAVVFAGGSWYGLEATTAVATAMKDDGLRDGGWVNIALSVGAIVYDLGERRFNEIYPDKRLAQAAYRASRPGLFVQGPHGAGRNVRSGGYFGCNAYSGQGGAFRQLGAVKIAAFTVVNALGVVTRRDGTVAACYPDQKWPQPLKPEALLAGLPDSRKPGWAPGSAADSRRNTTISLVVTNQKLDPAELQRLAVQVHTSMARALQPFATEFDGDVLYAVSTAELEARPGAALLSSADLGVIASEVMWDAVLASVPPQPAAASATRAARVNAPELDKLTGDYVFSRYVTIRISTQNGKLYAQGVGERDAYAIKRDQPLELQARSGAEFTAPSRYPLLLKFEQDGRLVVNPGHWEQVGKRTGQ